MIDIEKVLDELKSFNDWVQLLDDVKDDLFFTPIQEGKWTPAEIISHITYWDRYIENEILPQVKLGAQVTSVDFEVINTPAAAYALSGVSKQELVVAQMEARNNLLAALREKEEDIYLAPFTLNGEEIDEYSGYPNTLYNYLWSFVWHDNHHREQIVNFLSEHQITFA